MEKIMNLAISYPCDFENCTKDATKHVRFGLRANGSYVAEGGGRYIPTSTQHRNFCDDHVIAEKSWNTTVHELGNCPDNCDA